MQCLEYQLIIEAVNELAPVIKLKQVLLKS